MVMLKPSTNNHRGEGGFALVPELILVALIVIAAGGSIYLATHHSGASSSSKSVCRGLGPCEPAKSDYHAKGVTEIGAASQKTATDLASQATTFAKANAELKLEAIAKLDGCGLFSTQSNGDFTAAVGKVCVMRQNSYYSSTLDSVTEGRKLTDWLNPIVGSNNVNGYFEKPCSQIFPGGASVPGFNMESLDVYAVSKSAGNASCSYGLLPGNSSLADNFLAGYDSDYVDVRSDQVVDGQALLSRLRDEGKKTLVAVTWSKNYYWFQY